ncbi:hypothetical protein [Saccharopolyspora taberi]|uniref:Methyl-accepting chemotaxis protein n=1 Tax=Saccharopolyspora taberi TaxID=60895 RepID=A0ABN3VA91_9PSEU
MPAEDEAASTTDEGGEFTAVAALGEPEGRAAAEGLRTVCGELADAGVHTAVKRLHDVDRTVRDLPFPVIERLVAPERVLSEFAEVRAKPVNRLHTLRNQFALLPLLITWLSLALAVFDRDHLGEWLVATLPWVALVDAVLIGSIVVLTSLMHRKEAECAADNDRIARQLDVAMTSLAMAVERNTVTSPATPEQWAESVQKVIRDAIEHTGELAEANREVVENARAAVESARAKGEEMIVALAEQSRAAHQSFRESVDDLVKGIIKEATNVLSEAVAADRSLIDKQMAPLVDRFRESVDEFTTHFGSYQTSTSTLVGVVSELGAAASTLVDTAKSSNGTAESIDVQLRALAGTQQEFVTQVTGNAASMANAAEAMQAVSALLQERLESNLDQIATSLHSSSERMAEVDGRLVGTTEALSTASRELEGAASALRRTSGSRWWRFGR